MKGIKTSRKIFVFALLWFAVVTTVAIPMFVVAQEPTPEPTPTPTAPEEGKIVSAFIWTFIGALLFILGGWLKKTPPENFSGLKAIQTLVVALIVSLISIAFNIPPAEALNVLNQWIAAFLQLVSSTGIIALIEFWRLVIWRRLHPTQTPSPPRPS